MFHHFFNFEPTILCCRWDHPRQYVPVCMCVSPTSWVFTLCDIVYQYSIQPVKVEVLKCFKMFQMFTVTMFQMFTVNNVYSQQCLQSTMFTVNNVYSQQCLQSTMFTVNNVSNVYSQQCLHSTNVSLNSFCYQVTPPGKSVSLLNTIQCNTMQCKSSLG